MRRLAGLALGLGAGLAVAGCFGPSEGVLIVRDGAGGSVSVSGREDGNVTLEAFAEAGYAFAGWRCLSGVVCPEGSEGIAGPRATFEAGSEQALEAVFEFASPTTTLTLAEVAGGVASADCGGDCAGARGWAVRVEAVPDAGRRFRGWDCAGGAACDEFNLTSASIAGRVEGDVMLTPRYSGAEGNALTLEGVEGGVLRVLADCGAGCAAGGGWGASVSAVPPAGSIVSGWSCAEGGACPVGLDGVPALSFRVGGAVTIAAELSAYEVLAGSSVDFTEFAPEFEERTLCAAGLPCAHLVGGESDVLRVSLPEGVELEHEWVLVSGGPEIALGEVRGAEAGISVAADLGEVVAGTVEVVSRDAEGVVAGRQMVRVVGVPAALAVRVVGGRCMGESGFVVREGGEHYVISTYDSDYCLEQFLGLERYGFGIVSGGERRMFEGTLWGFDQVTGLAAFRIPDPGLAWVPGVAVDAHERTEPARVVGALYDRRLGPIAPMQVPFAVAEVEFMVADTIRIGCPSPDVTLEWGEFPEGCQYNHWVIMPAVLPNYFDGGPVFNADGQIVGSLGNTEQRGASVITDRLNTVVPTGGSAVVDALLQGGKRCIVRGDFTNPFGGVEPDREIGADGCSSRGLGG